MNAMGATAKDAADYEVRTVADRSILVVRGEIDLVNADDFRERIESLLDEGGSPTLVDLSAVSFIDSSGVAALVAARGRADSAGIELVLVDPSPQTRTVLEVTGLWTHFTTQP